MATEAKLEQEDRDRMRLYQYLKFARKQREDGRTVPDYNIHRESTLHTHLRLLRGRATMVILVRTMAPTTIVLEVKPSDTGYDVKRKVESTEGIPAREQRLIFGSGMLEDDRTLAYQGVRKGATVHLVVWSYL